MAKFRPVIALAIGALIPLALTTPAVAAVNPVLTTNLTIDCAVDSDLLTNQLPRYGDSITITLLNCETYNLYDYNNSGTATVDSGTLDEDGLIEADESPEVITVTGDARLEVWDVDGEANGNDYYFLDIFTPFEMANPTGAQLADTSQGITLANPSVTTYGTAEEIAQGDEIGIGGDADGCGIMPGDHVYATQTVTVTEAGDYTFRVTGVNPVGSYLDPIAGENTPFNDPMVALYTTFDPSDPNSGNVGCNDDLNDLVIGDHDFGDNDYNVTQQGDYVEGHFSYFSSHLEPGVYTMVFTTWETVSASDWAAGSSQYSDWTPGDTTIYFDIWGPNTGLTLGAPPAALANTGVPSAFGLWAALALVATGAGIMITRRRSQRA